MFISRCSFLQKYGPGIENHIQDLELLHVNLRPKIRANYIKKLKWILFKHCTTKWKPSLNLQDVAVIVGDLDILPPVQSLVMNGPTAVLCSLPCLCDLAPHIDHLMEGYNETYKEKIHWELIHNKASIPMKNRQQKLQASVTYAKQWMVSELVVCTRDDKSKKIAFIRNNLYSDLLLDFIAQSNSLLLDYDPTDKIASKLTILLKSDSFPTVWKVKKVSCPYAP